MDLDTMLTEAAPARHLPLDGPDSPAAVDLYQRITARPPGLAVPSRRRRFAFLSLIGVAAAAAAAAVALALLPGSPAAPGHRGGQGGATLAAWSVIKERHGLLKVTIRELRDPAGLQQMLRAARVPANVQFVNHAFTPTTSPHAIPGSCRAPRMSDEANAKLQEKIMPGIPHPASGVVVTISPSAIPHGIGLYLKAWAANGTDGGLSLQIDLVQATPECTG
jgi:hypothetical protein